MTSEVLDSAKTVELPSKVTGVAALSGAVRMQLMVTGLRLKTIRRAKGFSQAQAAVALDVSVNHVMDLEAGRVDVRIGTLAAYAELLGVDWRWLLSEVEV